jgi:hypothetical protein
MFKYKNAVLLSMKCILILIFLIVTGCSGDRFTPEIKNPEPVTFPIDSADEAVQYSLNLPQLQTELENASGGEGIPMLREEWWARVDNPPNQWTVTWFNGPGECQSLYGCQITFDTDGNITRKLQCEFGWNCK